MAQTTGNGIIAISSNHSVDQTVEKIKAPCKRKKSRFSRWWTIVEKRKR